MAETQILTLATPADVAGPAPALDTALALARALSAQVVALCVEVDVVTPGTGDADLAALRAAVGARAHRAGVPCDLRDRESFARGLGEEVADLLKLADLGVLQVHHRPVPGETAIRDAALFASGRPVIVVGGAAMTGAPRRIVLGWDDSPGAVRAMTAALPLMRQAGAVEVARVAEERPGRSAPTDARIVQYLVRHGIPATFRTVPRGRAEVFADLAAAAAGADLLVCGAVRRSRAQDMLFGGVTGAVLAGAIATPVLLMA